jgi:hypothetical protein
LWTYGRKLASFMGWLASRRTIELWTSQLGNKKTCKCLLDIQEDFLKVVVGSPVFVLQGNTLCYSRIDKGGYCDSARSGTFLHDCQVLVSLDIAKKLLVEALSELIADDYLQRESVIFENCSLRHFEVNRQPINQYCVTGHV